MSEIFKVGDRVYDHQHGWGTICSIKDSIYAIKVEFCIGFCFYTLSGFYNTCDKFPRLSFTEYDFVNGGFSQERPKPDIKPGQLIWVRNNSGSYNTEWQLQRFAQFIDKNIVCSGQHDEHVDAWDEYSIENPFKDEMDKY